MGTLTATLIIVIVLGIGAFAAWGCNALNHYEKEYLELDNFISKCENTGTNWKRASDWAIRLSKSKFILPKDLETLHRRIYNKFLMP